MPSQRRLGAGPQVGAVHDEDLLLREVAEVLLELERVAARCDRLTVLDHADERADVALDRPHHPATEPVVGDHPLDRVAHEVDKSCLGDDGRHALGNAADARIPRIAR